MAANALGHAADFADYRGVVDEVLGFFFVHAVFHWRVFFVELCRLLGRHLHCFEETMFTRLVIKLFIFVRLEHMQDEHLQERLLLKEEHENETTSDDTLRDTTDVGQ